MHKSKMLVDLVDTWDTYSLPGTGNWYQVLILKPGLVQYQLVDDYV